MGKISSSAFCNTIEVNCSQPDQPSLLAALSPAFDLSAIRPVENQRTYTNISVYFTLYGILGVDEKSQLLITYIWLYYWWRNEFISWDPVQCGTDWISLPKEKFWLPDVVINEFMEENKAPSVPYLYLFNDGKVKDSFPVRVVSSCNLNIYTFPFDIQNCSLTFNSYIYYATEIRVFLGRDTEITTELSKQVMTTMGEWELLDITAQKLVNDDESGLYTDMLSFYIRVRRRATMYVVNLLLPSCFLITVDLFSFLLPPQSTDRSSFKMTLILGYTVFLLIMNDLLPITGNTIPLINVFFSLCLALMVASLLETILITNLLSNLPDFSPVPRWIQVLVLNFLGCLVCMPRKTEKPKDSEQRKNTVVAKIKSDEDSQGTGGSAEEDEAVQELRSLSHVLHAIRSEVEQQQKGNQSSEEWIQVGFIIDRLLFGLYIIFISVSFITIIIVWVNSYNQ
ncbi:5-hydroxytryptamine receptor 3A-like [Anableps anableps]